MHGIITRQSVFYGPHRGCVPDAEREKPGKAGGTANGALSIAMPII